MKRVLILGGGTGGNILANRLQKDRRSLKFDLQITVVDPEKEHLYQPGLLFLPFGTTTRKKIIRQKRHLLRKEIRLVEQSVTGLDTTAKTVTVADGSLLPYDVLVVATGTRIAPEETEGLTGDGWFKNRFDFYTLEGATRLQAALRQFTGGHLVINIVDMPIKCPVAPLEFAFLADDYFKRRGIRDKVKISYVTPLDNAFTKPVAANVFKNLLAEKNIELITEFNTGRVENSQIISWDDRTVDFDLLVTVPLHNGADFVKNSDIGDDLGFVRVDNATLQNPLHKEIFALGDATTVPTSKAGSVAHFQAETVHENIMRYLAGEAPLADFDGHANCFIETGEGKAALIDFSYEVQPLPGSYPIPFFGPLRLLKVTRLNHWGKLAFRLIYWHLMLPARYLPISRHFSLRGKRNIA
jgi:sulfide:quinone oxidoreductase